MPPARPLPRLLALALLLAAACTTASRATGSAPTTSMTPSPTPRGPSPALSPGADLTKLERAREQIEHVIFIVQENRSFDHYFGTFPGAEGIPMRDGRPSVCAPDPILLECMPPYHTRSQLQEGGPHSQRASSTDVDGGRMDGFIRAVVNSPIHCADHRDDLACEAYLGPREEAEVQRAREDVPIWAWTDITYLLHEQGVSWSFYVGDDTCFRDPC